MERQNKDMSFSHLFSKALKAHDGWLHFAAHSHHLWPDVTETAQLAAWQDAAAYADRKWEKIFAEIMPEARGHIARILSLPDAASIAFAPNTHEFVVRLISCLPRQPKILTTDSEFHSAARQFARLEEAGLATITRINIQPFESFVERFCAAVESGAYDMVFLSQVFFNSGFVVCPAQLKSCDGHIEGDRPSPEVRRDVTQSGTNNKAMPELARIAAAVKPETMLVIDGYHGFMAVPTDFAELAERAFYVAGGYKYAMSGEGTCFMHCPPYFTALPTNTGWYAAFGALEKSQGQKVAFASGGGAFMGATFDPSGLYRFNAVQRMLQQERLGVDKIHTHVQNLQRQFMAGIANTALGKPLFEPADSRAQAHFLTFVTPQAAVWYNILLKNNIVSDVRGDRLRLGFGLYHNQQDIAKLLEKLANLKDIMLSEHPLIT